MPTPLGDISTPNITPDKTTGIGNWTDDQFYKAMHEAGLFGSAYEWFVRVGLAAKGPAGRLSC